MVPSGSTMLVIRKSRIVDFAYQRAAHSVRAAPVAAAIKMTVRINRIRRANCFCLSGDSASAVSRSTRFCMLGCIHPARSRGRLAMPTNIVRLSEKILAPAWAGVSWAVVASSSAGGMGIAVSPGWENAIAHATGVCTAAPMRSAICRAANQSAWCSHNRLTWEKPKTSRRPTIEKFNSIAELSFNAQ